MAVIGVALGARCVVMGSGVVGHGVRGMDADGECDRRDQSQHSGDGLPTLGYALTQSHLHPPFEVPQRALYGDSTYRKVKRQIPGSPCFAAASCS